MKKPNIKTCITSLLAALFLLSFFSTAASAKSKETPGTVTAPTASLKPGSFYKEQTVTLHSSTPGTNIYYTTDGSTPDKNSFLYTEAIALKETTTIKAIAVRGNVNEKALKVSNGNTHSEIASFTYTSVKKEALANQFLSFTYDSMPYRLYVPGNYDPAKSYPLVLFLHGGGERGGDNEKQLIANDGALIWAAPENQANHQAFVLAPQARNVWDGGFGRTRDENNNISLSRVFEPSEDLAKAYQILQEVRGKYNIDSNRLYSTGVSQGGFGTFNLNLMYPDLFAAMVPIAGGGDPKQAQLLVNKPIWAFHAEDDMIIPVSYTRNIISAIKEKGGNPIYTEYPAAMGYNHASWTPAYENQKMIEWVFQQVKPSNEQNNK